MHKIHALVYVGCGCCWLACTDTGEGTVDERVEASESDLPSPPAPVSSNAGTTPGDPGVEPGGDEGMGGDGAMADRPPAVEPAPEGAPPSEPPPAGVPPVEPTGAPPAGVPPEGASPVEPPAAGTPPAGVPPAGTPPAGMPENPNVPADPNVPVPPGPEPFEANFLWSPLVLAQAEHMGHTPTQIAEAEQQPAGDLAFEEVSTDVGLSMARGSGNQHGVGIGFVDIDNDGWDDLYIANGSGRGDVDSMLFRNEQGTFVNVTEASGIAAIVGSTDTYSIAAGDYDADGDADLLIGAHPVDLLLQNDGNGVFTNATAQAQAGGPISERTNTASKIAAFGDFDGDGWLDIVSASSEFKGHPENGYLLRNLGNGTFEDITASTGFAAASSGNPCAVMWSDIDNDGDQDLWIWNDRGNRTENRVLLRNDGGQTLVNITEEAGINKVVGNPMGIDGVDLNRDGLLDYYISAIGNNPLYMNNGDGTFTDAVRDTKTGHDYGWGLGFEDFDHDSWSDIFVAQEDDRPYLAFRHNGSTTPEFTRFELSHHEIEAGGQAHNVAVAFADYNHDGLVDIATATTDGSRVNLFRNATMPGTQRWLEVRVGEVPGTGARGGISARVVVKTGDAVQFRDINGGASRASQSAHSARFGLGQWTGAEWVGVLWPDGRQVAVRGVEGNQVLELR